MHVSLLFTTAHEFVNVTSQYLVDNIANTFAGT